MIYIILPQGIEEIESFYHNVAKKYAHTYSVELMHKNIDEAIDSMYQIENGLLRRDPLLTRWQGCYMANTSKWYYAYKIIEDKIIVIDACHAQNMTDAAIN